MATGQPMPADPIAVEVVIALRDSQAIVEISLPDGSTLGDAIEHSRIGERFPQLDIATLAVGIWGSPAERDHPLRDGDRVELYRPLQLDPREARRKLALLGRTMRHAVQDDG